MSNKPDYVFQIPASLLMKLTGADNTEQAVMLAEESFGANVRIVSTEPIVIHGANERIVLEAGESVKLVNSRSGWEAVAVKVKTRMAILAEECVELNKASDPQYYQKFRDNRRTRSKK